MGAKNIIKEFLEIYEDFYWNKEVEKRVRNNSKDKYIPHKDVWR